MKRELIQMKRRFSHLRHHLLTLMFLLGFALDNLTLNRVDQKFDNAVLAFYVLLAMASMSTLYAGIATKFNEKKNEFFRYYSPFVIQYALGGLLSGMLIFYGRSGAFYESWPFLLMILGVIYGNETITDRVSRFVFNLLMFFIGMFSYVVLLVPVVLGKMGPTIFVGSGLIALLIMYVFFGILSRIIPRFIALHKRSAIFVIGLAYVLFNFLYFANIIPPIPLSLKDIGIFDRVVRFENDKYQLTYEEPKYWELLRDSDSVFHYSPGDTAYCFASVFAPTRLSTTIYHTWEYYDDAQKQWIEHGRFSYQIDGGRGEGYRGYTQISSLREGTWRCTVETERGQSLGRETFEVVNGAKGNLVTREE